MITAQQIKNLVEEKIAGTDYFVVEISVRSGNLIELELDRDSGMTIEACTEIHRFIVSQLDREVEDYSLLVSSPGVGEPIKVARQYPKNVGRQLELKTADDQKKTGTLISANSLGIELLVKEIETIPGKKKKMKIEKTYLYPFDQIKEARVEVSFK